MCKHDWTRLTAGALLALTLTACSAAPTAEPAPLPADTTVESVQPETAAPAETPGAAETPAEDLTAVGSLLLSLNPEVRMHYSADGLVVSLEGRNDDGRAVVAALGDQAGRPCDEVADDLVEQLYGGGYLNGGGQSIVVKLEAGSEEPGTQVLEAVADGIHTASVRCGAEAQALTVSGQELDDSGRLTVAAAEALALEQLGIAEAQFTPRTYDDDVYELEFTSGGVRYAYEMDANTGKLRAADYAANGDWAYYDDLEDVYDDDWDDRYDDDWDDRYDDDWDDRYDDDWDDRYDDDWDDQYDDDWDDQYDDDWDDQYDDDWDDQYDDDWDDRYDDDWDDRYDDWDDRYDDDWDDRYDDDWDDQYDDDWDD